LRPELLAAYGAIEHELKQDTSIVTHMDLMVEERLKAMLAELDNSIGFSGEETGVNYDQKIFWLVDPIDGTEPFVRGLPFSTNMITLIDHGKPVFSVVYNFFLDEYYMAIKGRGATCNGHQVHVSKRTLDRSFVISGSGFGRVGLVGVNERLRAKVAALPQFNASGFQFAAIARGGIDGCVSWNPRGKAWDYAPGSLLVTEAGGRIENIGTGDYDYRKWHFVAANPVIFDDLMTFMLEETASVREKA